MSGDQEVYNPSGITDAPPTPEQAAAVATGKAKLNDMLKGSSTTASTPKPRPTGPPAHIPSARRRADDVPPGRTTSTPDAAAVAARDVNVSPRELLIKALNQPGDDGIFSSDPVKQKAAVAELRTLLAAEATQEEKDAFANLPIGTLREAHGVEGPDLPSNLKDQWSTELEAEGLIAMQEHGIPPAVVQNLYDWYVQRGISNLGQFGPEDLAAFREHATKQGLTSEFIEQLIAWHGGGAA